MLNNCLIDALLNSLVEGCLSVLFSVQRLVKNVYY